MQYSFFVLTSPPDHTPKDHPGKRNIDMPVPGILYPLK
jgi:hypothetical protein